MHGVVRALAVIAAAGAMSLAGPASANEHLSELPILLGDLLFPADAGSGEPSPVISFQIPIEPNGQPIVGFRVSFDYSEPGGADDSWASDLRMLVIAPSGESQSIGSAIFPGEEPFGPPDLTWAFDGPASDDPGPYESIFYPWKLDMQARGGLWSFDFVDGFDGGTLYSEVTVTMLKVPSPSALALIGVAGLAARRTRRR